MIQGELQHDVQRGYASVEIVSQTVADRAGLAQLQGVARRVEFSVTHSAHLSLVGCRMVMDLLVFHHVASTGRLAGLIV